MTAIGLAGSFDITLSAGQLLLGHPKRPSDANLLSSQGCASGASLEDAALRGLLELIEVDALRRWKSGDAVASPVAWEPIGRQLALAERLLNEGRQLRICRIGHRSTARVFMSICCDIGGARPSIGSAAGIDPTDTLDRALIESVFMWRNLVAMEHRGVQDTDLSPLHLEILKAWRGQIALPTIQDSDPAPLGAANAPNVPAECSMASLSNAWGESVAVFNMTRQPIGIPVVRVVRLDE